jgi:hypothetical protein
LFIKGNLSMKRTLLFSILFFILKLGFTQNLTLEKSFLTDYLRNRQLLDSFNQDRSFLIRPLNLVDDSIQGLSMSKEKKYFNVLPIAFQYNYNSDHPVGINLGAIYPTKGSQFYITGGLIKNINKWTIYLQPEIVYANNDHFRTFPNEHYDPIWASYYQWNNKIDLPEKFGNEPIFKILPGQSKIEYSFSNNFSVKLSTENIWWGPGNQQSLVISNNANGFTHLSVQTKKPIQTKVGSFEAQLLFGSLQNSNIEPDNMYKVFQGDFLYKPKLDEKRFITGYIITWQPKWTKGLFLGLANSSITYQKDLQNIADFLPTTNIIKTDNDKNGMRASLGSMFARYLLPKANAEVYMEYGRSDEYPSLINMLNGQRYPRGFIAGFRRISNQMKHHLRLEVTAEIAQLDATYYDQVINANSWYTHPYIRQGFTQNGKVLGAGIGPGGTSQMLDISFLKGTSKMGLMLQRSEHNKDFYFNAYQDWVNFKSHWVDLSAVYHAYVKVNKKIFINAQLAVTNSINYNWWYIPLTDPLLPGSGYDVLNYHSNIMVVYSF